MKAKAIVGFVLAVVAIVLAWWGWSSLFALPMAIVGLVLSAVAGKEFQTAGQSFGLATAGFVVGIVATVICSITFFTCGICTICVASEAAAIGLI